jgi:hypothetical protein
VRARSNGGVLLHVLPVVPGPEEDAVHFVFTCEALHAARDQLHDALDSVTSGAFGQLLYDAAPGPSLVKPAR